jgi:hypothetical protein
MNRLGKCGKLSDQPVQRDRAVARRDAKGMVDMMPEDEWNAIRRRRAPLFGVAGMGMLRVALLFGSAAVALALILAPMADRYDKSQFVGLDGIDFMATSSTGNRNAYTIRRSVLQAPGSVCIIYASGRRSGDC